MVSHSLNRCISSTLTASLSLAFFYLGLNSVNDSKHAGGLYCNECLSSYNVNILRPSWQHGLHAKCTGTFIQKSRYLQSVNLVAHVRFISYQAGYL